MATTSSETDKSDNDWKFVAFGRKNTGITHINGLDDLCQDWPSKAKAKDLQSQGQGHHAPCLKAKAKD